MNPTSGKIYYEKGKKFQSTRDCLIKTLVTGYNIETDFCKLTPDGLLLIYKGWAWDGASGGVDTKKTIRASASHDALYKLMRMEFLPRSEQENSDLTLREVMRRDKAIIPRTWAWFTALSWFGGKNTDPENRNKELIAP